MALYTDSLQIGLIINIDKTKIMIVHVVPILIQVGDSNLNLGHIMQLGRSIFEKEVNHRM